jgi:hypothetical protein
VKPAIFFSALKRDFCRRHCRVVAPATKPRRNELAPRTSGRVCAGLTDIRQRSKSAIPRYTHPGATRLEILASENSWVTRPPSSGAGLTLKKFVAIRSNDEWPMRVGLPSKRNQAHENHSA